MELFELQKGLLFKEEAGVACLVVPTSLRKQVIRRIHVSGHFSVAKTEAMVRWEYWFPTLKSQVEKVVRSCISCILAKKKGGKKEGW